MAETEAATEAAIHAHEQRVRALAGDDPDLYPLAEELVMTQNEAAANAQFAKGGANGDFHRWMIARWEDLRQRGKITEEDAAARIATHEAQIARDIAAAREAGDASRRKLATAHRLRVKLDRARRAKARPNLRARCPAPRRGSERRARAPRRRPPTRRARLGAVASGGGGDGPAPSDPASPAPSPRALEGGSAR